MINNNWQTLGVGLMDTLENRSPAILPESSCPCDYDQSPSLGVLVWQADVSCSFFFGLTYRLELLHSHCNFNVIINTVKSTQCVHVSILNIDLCIWT